jgi:hypothetical protein
MGNKMSDKEFDRQYEEALKRGAEKAKTEIQAKAASYDRGNHQLVLELKNGVELSIPCNLILELEDADPDLISEVELFPRGAALHWEKLNQDFSVAGLLADIFGKEVLAELGRKGGRVSSDAKVEASRINGQKGGRPRKDQYIPEASYMLVMNARVNTFSYPYIALANSVRELSLEGLFEVETLLIDADLDYFKETPSTNIVRGNFGSGIGQTATTLSAKSIFINESEDSNQIIETESTNADLAITA